MAKYRAAVIGIGWMGMLNDIGTRWTDPGPYGGRGQWHVDDVDRSMPKVDVHRKFYFHDGRSSGTYAETLVYRPEVDLIAGAERDKARLKVFGERYGVKALYTDAAEMLRNERPEIVAISSNTKHRSELTVLAVENGARGVMMEKPIAYTLGGGRPNGQSLRRRGRALLTGSNDASRLTPIEASHCGADLRGASK